MAEPLRSAGFVLVPERPVVLFLAPLDETTDLEPPRLEHIAREAKLTVGDSDLGRPPVRVDAGSRLPNRIPGTVATGIADADPVGLRAGWIDLEEGATQVIVIRVDDDLEVIGVEGCVAPYEPRRHACRPVGVEHLRADIQRVVIEEEAHLGPL